MEVSSGRSALNPYIAVVVGLLALALYVTTTGKTIPKDLSAVEKSASAELASATTASGSTAAPPSAATSAPAPSPFAAPPTPASQVANAFASRGFGFGQGAPGEFGSAARPSMFSRPSMVPPSSLGMREERGQFGGAFGEPSDPEFGLETRANYGAGEGEASWFGSGADAPASAGTTAAATAVSTATAASLASDAGVGSSVLWTLLSIMIGVVVFFGLLAVLGRLGGVDISAAIRRGVGSTPGLYDVTLSQASAPPADPVAPQPAGSDSQVFQVGNGNLTYVEARGACQAEGAKLATYSQLEDAYNNGAEWCSYGWSEGQLALFPTQQATYDRLQKGCTGDQNSCGRPGINGGYIANPNVRFAANCYGSKPKPTKAEKRTLDDNVGSSPQDSEAARLAQLFRAADKHFKVRPFAPGEWSETATSGSSVAASQNVPADMQATL